MTILLGTGKKHLTKFRWHAYLQGKSRDAKQLLELLSEFNKVLGY